MKTSEVFKKTFGSLSETVKGVRLKNDGPVPCLKMYSCSMSC